MLKDAKWCGRQKESNKGFRREQQRLKRNNWEEAPSRLPSRPRKISYDYYSTPSIAPLWRYLEANVGKPWSEVMQKIPPNQADNLRWTFKNDVVEQDGSYFSVKGWDGYFFVKDDILCKLPKVRYKSSRPGWKLQKVGRNFDWYEVWYREVKKGVVIKQENLITYRKGIRTVVHHADVLEFDGKTFSKRNDLWYRRDVVGMREIIRGHYEGTEWVREKVGEEPIYKEFQVNGKKQRELNGLLREGQNG